MYNKIMVPLDGSKLAECVLPHVEGFIKGLPESRVVFVRVVEPLPLPAVAENVRTGREISLEDKDAERKSNAQDYLNNIIEQIKTTGAFHEKQRIQEFPPKTQSNPETDGRAAGHLAKGNPQLRAGMAKCAGACGAADVFSGFQIGGEQEKQKTLLADQKMPP